MTDQRGSDDAFARHLRVPDHVVSRRFPAETVVLNAQTSEYQGFDAVAAAMFDAVASATTIDDAATELCSRYDAPEDVIRADLLEFVERCVERELLVDSE